MSLLSLPLTPSLVNTTFSSVVLDDEPRGEVKPAWSHSSPALSEVGFVFHNLHVWEIAWFLQ